MNATAAEPARPLDKRPSFWMLGILCVMVAVVLAFQFAGNQKLHNTTLWERFHPVTMTSPPQLATPVEVIDTCRVAHVVVQTDKGLYFLTGAKNVPEKGARVVVQTNARWDQFLCAEDGSRCMSIHSFCADAVWPDVHRDEEGRIAGCSAPRALDSPVPEPTEVRPLSAVPGSMGKRKRPPPPVGLSHPREWAWRMGLPVPSR